MSHPRSHPFHRHSETRFMILTMKGQQGSKPILVTYNHAQNLPYSKLVTQYLNLIKNAGKNL